MLSYSPAPGKIAFWSNKMDANAVTNTSLFNLKIVTAVTISDKTNKNRMRILSKRAGKIYFFIHEESDKPK